MGLHELTSEKAQSQLFHKRVPILGSEVNGGLEALGGVVMLSQFCIDASSLTPQLPRLGHLIYLLPPQGQHFSRRAGESLAVDAFRNEATSVAPLFGGFSEDSRFLHESEV